jgi:23S rRNA (guanosine2251-2'-O)-methyltransferase
MMEKLTMENLARMSTAEFKNSQKSNISIVLDDVRSMSNVGSIFRTADCFLVDKIYICGISPQPPHREIEKTALGATRSVDWEYHADAISLLKKLQEDDYQVICIEQVKQSVNLLEFRPNNNQKYVLILGNEVFGVKQEIVDMSNTVLEIPQFGTKHSFNVSVTAAIVLWDFYSKMIGSVR